MIAASTLHQPSLHRISKARHDRIAIERQSEISSEEIERRIEFIIEQQARFSEDMLKTQRAIDGMQQAIAGLIQAARTHDEQIDRNTEQINRNSEQIKEINESLKEQRGHIDALIRVVESHVSNHN